MHNNDQKLRQARLSTATYSGIISGLPLPASVWLPEIILGETDVIIADRRFTGLTAKPRKSRQQIGFSSSSYLRLVLSSGKDAFRMIFQIHFFHDIVHGISHFLHFFEWEKVFNDQKTIFLVLKEIKMLINLCDLRLTKLMDKYLYLLHLC